jgi:hypothetical protein
MSTTQGGIHEVPNQSSTTYNAMFEAAKAANNEQTSKILSELKTSIPNRDLTTKEKVIGTAVIVATLGGAFFLGRFFGKRAGLKSISVEMNSVPHE